MKESVPYDIKAMHHENILIILVRSLVRHKCKTREIYPVPWFHIYRLKNCILDMSVKTRLSRSLQNVLVGLFRS